MTFNEGTWDRAVRILVGLVLECAAWLTWPGTAHLLTPTGIVNLVFLIVGLVLLVTGLTGWCPVYRLFGWTTKAKVGA
jgi:hypothetical protein